MDAAQTNPQQVGQPQESRGLSDLPALLAVFREEGRRAAESALLSVWRAIEDLGSAGEAALVVWCGKLAREETRAQVAPGDDGGHFLVGVDGPPAILARLEGALCGRLAPHWERLVRLASIPEELVPRLVLAGPTTYVERGDGLAAHAREAHAPAVTTVESGLLGAVAAGGTGLSLLEAFTL